MNAAALRVLKERCVKAGVCWRCRKGTRQPIVLDARGRGCLCADHKEQERKRARDRHRDKAFCMDCPKGSGMLAVASWRCKKHADRELARRRLARLARAKRHPLFGERLTVAEIADVMGIKRSALQMQMNLRHVTAEEGAMTLWTRTHGGAAVTEVRRSA